MPFANGSRGGDPIAALMALGNEPLGPAQGAPRRKTRQMHLPEPPPKPAEPAAEPFDPMDYAPTAIRALGGLVGSVPIAGAAGGGLSEVAAQLLEGGDLRPWEIAAATGAGALGGGMVNAAAKAGAAPLRAALAAAPWAAAQPVVRSLLTEGQLPSWQEVGTNTAAGAGVAGGVAGLLKMLKVPLPGDAAARVAKAAKPAQETYQLEQTITDAKGRSTGLGTTARPVKATAQKANPILQMLGASGDDMMSPRVDSYRSAYPTSIEGRDILPGSVPANAPDVKELRHAAGAERAAWDMVGKERDAQVAADRIAAAREGLEPAPPSVSDSYSAKIPGGTERATQRWVKPAEDEADNAVQGAIDTFTPPAATPAPLATLEQVLGVAPKAPSQASARWIEQPIEDNSVRAMNQRLEWSSPAPLERPPLTNPIAPQRFGIEGEADQLTALQNSLGLKPGMINGTGAALTGAELAAANGPRGVTISSTERGLPPVQRGQMTEAEIASLPERRVGAQAFEGGERRAEDWRYAPADVQARVDAAQGTQMEAADPVLGKEFLAGLTSEVPAQQIIPLSGVGRSQAQVSGEHYGNLKRIFAPGGEAAGVSPDVQRVARNKVAGRAAARTIQEEASANLAKPNALENGPEVPMPSGVGAQAAATPKTAASPGLLQRLLGEGSAPVGASPTKPAEDATQGLLERYNAIQNPVARTRFEQSLPPGEWQALQKALGTKPGTGWRSEAGAIDPALLARIGLGATGALVGGAMDPLDNPILSALAGAGIGALAPTVATKVGELAPQLLAARPDLDPDTKGFLGSLTSPDGVMNALKEGLKRIPQAQRANMLSSPNILNNAFVGPWTSGLWLGLERALAGDPRGIEMIKAQRPDLWAQRYYEGWSDTANLVHQWERADAPMIGQTNSMIDKWLAGPGTIMTGGDLATRTPASELFGEDLARRATMTNEPFTGIGKSIVDFQRRGPVQQTLLPFARTLVNIGEEGALRTPILGSLLQATREVPDDAKVQLVQQLLGGATAGAGYLAGSKLDDVAAAVPGDDKAQIRFLRNLLSNAAGPNAALMNVGMAAGAAGEAGKTPLQQVGAGVVQGAQDVPLPTMDPIISTGRFLQAEPGKRKIPAGVFPGPVRDYINDGLTGAKPGKPHKGRTGNKGRKGHGE